MSAIHQDPRYKRAARARLKAARAANERCCRCGEPIDYRLSGKHPWGPTVEHLVPAMLDPAGAFDLANMGVAHRWENLRAGASLGGKVITGQLPRATPTPRPATRRPARAQPGRLAGQSREW